MVSSARSSAAPKGASTKPAAKPAVKTAMPEAETPTPATPQALPRTWRWVRMLILFFAATLPLYFDLSVPEVSGDIRWMATTFFAGLCSLLLLWQVRKTTPQQGLCHVRGPLVYAIAAGLAFWALLSLTDALNAMRGIILIKALYAQLLLMVCVATVAKPTVHTPGHPDGDYARALLWALSAPLAITAFIGILQFFQFNQMTFDAALSGTIWMVFSPLFSMLGWLLNALFGWWVPAWPQTTSLVDQLTGYFLQSAVPGGSFANKNLAGSYTAMMIPLMAYLLISARRWWERGLASALLSLGLVFLIFARARASWLALMAACAVGVVLLLSVPALRQYIKGKLKAHVLVWLLLPAAVLWQYGGAISPVQGSYAIDRTPAQQLAALGTAEGGWNEYGGRLAYNLNSMVITKDYGFNGVGLGSFFGIYPAYHDAIVTTPTNSYNVMARPQRTHSDVMQAFTEMGIMGGLLYVGVFVAGLGMGFRLAGPSVGRLGGALVGGGMSTAILLLTLFLSQKGMLQLPGLGHGVLVTLLASMAGWFGWRALRLIRALNTQKAAPRPLTEWQVAGFFGTLGLLTICLNSFLDFPMQLPTAPAAAFMLIGLMTALHTVLYPTGWRFNLKAIKPSLLPLRKLVGVGMVVLALAWAVGLYDAYKFRQGNALLKYGMIRIYSGLLDETTWQILQQANTVYPLDPRIHENMGVLYANYHGATPIPLEERIAGLEWVTAGDPWAPNHLINLSGLYIQAINQARLGGNEPLAQTYLVKLQDAATRMMRVADFSHMSWGVMGIYTLLAGHPSESIPLLQRALTIQPDYAPAISALQTAVSLTGVAPVVVKDALTQRAP